MLGEGPIRIARRLADAEEGQRRGLVGAVAPPFAGEGASEDLALLLRRGTGEGLEEGPAQARVVVIAAGEDAFGEGPRRLDELGVVEGHERLERRGRARPADG